MDFDDDYGGSIMTGGGLKEQLAASGEPELVLTMTSVSRRLFKDAKDEEWVISFDETLDELRVKKQLGKVIRDALGKNSDSWIGHKIALSTKHVTWTDYYGKDQEGDTIVARVIPANAYAAATGGDVIPF